jgi:hypothetical protein
MPKKPRPAKKKAVSAKTRAADDRLRDELRHADLGKFEKALKRAIRPVESPRTRP